MWQLYYRADRLFDQYIFKLYQLTSQEIKEKVLKQSSWVGEVSVYQQNVLSVLDACMRCTEVRSKGH